MLAVTIVNPGPESNLKTEEQKIPELGAEEVLIKIEAFSLNRADLLQMGGNYNPPPGVTDVPGLECAGTIAAIGRDVKSLSKGDNVMALLAGGGYSTFASVHVGSVMKTSLTAALAGAIPEAWLTAYQLISFIGKALPGETVLVHAAASGVGTAAIQILKSRGCSVIATCSAAKSKICRELGADMVISREEVTTAQGIAKARNKADVILDCIGASYWHFNAEAARMEARWVLYGFLGGHQIPSTSIGFILRKRLRMEGTTLRSRSLAYKAKLCSEFGKNILPSLESGKLRPIIHQMFSITDPGNCHIQVLEAREVMRKNLNRGKLVCKF